MRIAYFGTPDFSASLLDYLCSIPHAPFSVQLVITRSDKHVGRKKILTPSPVKKVAQKWKIAVCEKIQEAPSHMREKKVECALLFAYGKIIPPELLILPRNGFFNIHPSLLPLYRGASPLPYAIAMGEVMSGITLLKMDTELDHGPIIAQESIPIGFDEKADEMMSKVVNGAGTLLEKVFQDDLENIQYAPQEHNFATYTRRLTRRDGFISPELLKKALTGTAAEEEDIPPFLRDYRKKYIFNATPPLAASTVYNIYRGLSPWPGLWTHVLVKGREKRCKLTDITYSHDRIIINKIHIEGEREKSYSDNLQFD